MTGVLPDSTIREMLGDGRIAAEDNNKLVLVEDLGGRGGSQTPRSPSGGVDHLPQLLSSGL